MTLNQDTTVKEIQELFAQDQRVVLVDNPSKNEYPLAIHSTGKDEVFVGRIRRDDSLKIRSMYGVPLIICSRAQH